MLPRFQEPILGQVKVPRIEEAFDSRNFLPSTALKCYIFSRERLLKQKQVWAFLVIYMTKKYRFAKFCNTTYLAYLSSNQRYLGLYFIQCIQLFICISVSIPRTVYVAEPYKISGTADNGENRFPIPSENRFPILSEKFINNRKYLNYQKS